MAEGRWNHHIVWHDCLQVEIFNYAFASPRVGNTAFSNDFLAGTGEGKPLNTVAFNQVDKSYRFTHKGDLVPTVPPPGWPLGCVIHSILLVGLRFVDVGLPYATCMHVRELPKQCMWWHRCACAASPRESKVSGWRVAPGGGCPSKLVRLQGKHYES